MGFKRDKTYALRWADGSEFAGLEVEARVLPIGYMEQFGSVMAFKDRAGDDDFTQEDMATLVSLFTDFAEQALVAWNFETDDGEPVPATVDGMRRVDFEMGIEIITEWVTAVTAVSEKSDGDLGKDSPPGGTSPAVSIPMEPLSPGPASSTTPT